MYWRGTLPARIAIAIAGPGVGAAHRDQATLSRRVWKRRLNPAVQNRLRFSIDDRATRRGPSPSPLPLYWPSAAHILLGAALAIAAQSLPPPRTNASRSPSK
jgi:hypothetical protein